MRKSLLLIAVLGAVGFALPAKAQTAQGEVYVGYAYTRDYIAGSTFGVSASSLAYSYNGGVVQGQYNINDYLSVVGYFGGGVTGSKTITPTCGCGSYTLASSYGLNYGGGPRLYISRGKVAPFMEVGLGAVHLSQAPPIGAAGNSFQMLAGGGVDVNLTSHISIRPAEFDYVFSKFPDGAHNVQNGFSYTGGIIFRIGSK